MRCSRDCRRRSQLQDFGGVGPFLGNAIRIAIELGAIARHDLVQLGLPLRARNLVLEHGFKHGQHDWRGGRCTRRSAQQTGDAAIFGADNFGTQFQHAALLFITLDDLNALAGLPQAPVFRLGIREVLFQRIEAVFVRQHQLTGQVFNQRVLFDTDFGHWPDVVGGGAGQQVQVRTFFEELGGEGSERAKQNDALAIQHAGVQVRNRHRWRAYRSLTVSLGQMLLGNSRVIGHQERAANREACVFLGFRNAGLLQQVQCTAACADKYKLGVGGSFRTVFQIFVNHMPGAISVAGDVLDFTRQLQREVGLGLQVSRELTRDFAEVDVGTQWRPGGRDFLVRVTPFHHQRNPLLDLNRVFGVLHAGEQRARLQCFVALLQELDVVIAPHKAHVRSGVDERTRIFQYAVLDLPGPELTRYLEGFIDFNGLRDFDVTVLVFRGVVQLGQSRVTGTRVVPAIGAFKGNAIETFNHLHGHAGFQLIEPDTQSCAHDAAADQQNIHLFGLGSLHGRKSHGQRQAQ